ncbi:HlyD family efflux transporter periplasmic adaptor subunit [Aquincola sp. MAHUQ-54]|uniref:HlyD family efflux transporter periplasmic adaptor subunit n=1 Tax=Aquincola agrisoli TaxID=3119538 RepID=A0AAW9QBR0_9BURK
MSALSEAESAALPQRGAPVGADGDPWAALGGARSAEQLCTAWLFLLCRRIPPTRAALLLLKDAQGTFVPAAMFPAPLDAGYLAEVAQQALNSGAGARQPQPDGSLRLAYPLASMGTMHGVVVLDLGPCDELGLTRHLRDLHWGAGWLLDLVHRRSIGERDQRLAHAGFLLDLQAALMAQPDAERALFTLVNRLAAHFGCHQVLVGTARGHAVQVRAMSHAAWFDERANLLRGAAQAMDEAYDQRARTTLPESEGDGTPRLTAALRRYAADARCAAVCALPLEHGNTLAGVCLLQRDTPFDAGELQLLDTLGLAIGPVVGLRLAGDESLPAHAGRSTRWLLSRLGDGSRPGWKLAGVAAALALAVLALVEVDYRVASKALVEGAVQRAAVAPFDGFVREAPARAGDTVRKGEVLALLEDKDLRLESQRWQAELDIAEKRERESRANGERAELRLAAAQAAQARAQLDLVNEKLARVQVVAPFDGVVVRGDLSQQLGSPVEIGKVLFELAPLDAWRVILQVDERDIAHIAEQRSGELVLSSLPDKTWPLRVSKITPVSVPEDGRNHFRVEAELDGPAGDVRPGMEGVAKVASAPRSLLWIWTHRFTDWLRLALWRLAP